MAIDSEWDINKIIEMTKEIYSDIFFSGDIYKDRTPVNERRRFSIPFYEEQKDANVGLPPKLLGGCSKS